ESTVFTNNYLLEFLLKFEKYNITHNYNEGKYIILEFDFPKNLTLLKEFKEKCHFSSIRTLNCDSFVIRIFYKH
ncbi:MAG: hypothetical protein NZ893_02125, partial [Candidatus Aenigmarchaeota archaeon]|nr:hypothetical protein [Candidatus Aenigmarchaeota archaeon]